MSTPTTFWGMPALSRYGKTHFASAIVMGLIVMAMQGAIAGVFIAQVDINLTNGSVPPGEVFHPPPSMNCNATAEAGPDGNNNARSIIVYLIILILAQVYSFYIVVDALYQQNTIQVFMHVGFTIACFAYSITQYFQLEQLLISCTLNVAFRDISTLDFQNPTCNPGCQLFDLMVPLIAVCIAVLGFFSLVYIWLAFKLYLEFGWKIYKKIGAAPEMRSMYRAFQIFIMLLKLDFFFFEAFAIQFLYLVLHTTDPEFALTIVAIIITPFILIGAYYAICYENKIASCTWCCVLLGVGAYYLFKIVRIYESDQAYKYVGSGKFLTLFAALGLLVTVCSLINTIVCILNFDKGLKPYLVSDKARANTDSGKQEDPPGRQRMELE